DDQFALVPLGNVPRLAATLSRVLKDEALRRKLGAASRKQAVAQLSLDQYKNGIEQVLRETAATGGTGSTTLAEIRSTVDLQI
ncbi:MAG TPA: hypothetical protein VIW64_13240, partial [Pyrinomonadaceae bacterium]